MSRKMKPSGIEWIGDIPEEWRVMPVRYAFEEVKEKNSDGRIVNALQFKNGSIIRKKNFSADSDEYVADTILSYTKVNSNDIVINGLNLNYDLKSLRVGIVTEIGVITSAYLVIKPNSEIIDPFFANFLFKGYETKMAFHNMGAGIRLTLGYKEFRNQPILLPLYSEQQKISSYLDTQCAHIDNIIEKTKASIEEYKKLKQAVITQAVTKGVRGEREMKDSGIEWIGEIPVEWHIIKITRILKENHPYPIGDGDHGLVKTDDYLYEGIPYIRVQNIGWGTPILIDNIVYISEEKNSQIKNSTLKPNDILFAKTGATIGKTAIVPDNIPIANTTSHVGKITVSDLYFPRYIFYVLSSYVGFRQFWETACLKSTRPELSIDEIKGIRLLIPELREEQQEIAAYLDQKCAEIDAIITKKLQFITEMESYKKSLIFECVTGKREVLQ